MSLPGWRSPQQAFANAMSQLSWYREMETIGEMIQIKTKDELTAHLNLWEDLDDYQKKPIGYILALEGADGTAVDGTSSVDGDMVYFTPSAPLQPSTSYVANLTYCGSEAPVAVGFSTSDLGTVADDVSVFEGKTYAVDLSSGNFVQPAGVGDLIGGLLENNILIGVTASTETSISGVPVFCKSLEHSRWDIFNLP